MLLKNKKWIMQTVKGEERNVNYYDYSVIEEENKLSGMEGV